TALERHAIGGIMWKLVVAGIIGSIATTLVTAVLAVVTNFGGYLAGISIDKAADLVVDSFHVTLREGSTSNRSDFSAKCLEHEIIVGGLCIIESGDGALQNQGTTKDGKGYVCTYSRRADPAPTGVNGKIFAACLGLNLKRTSQSN
ncbi:MAG: hypothetical protein WBF43_00550, partial [Methylocella sp.]